MLFKLRRAEHAPAGARKGAIPWRRAQMRRRVLG
jgi:hypothetical protein